MIVFQLICDNGHDFEGWFQSGEAFEQQSAAGEIECPHCASRHVTKGIMSPNVATKGAITTSSEREDKQQVFRTKMMEMATAMREQVEKTCDNVGSDFPEEARRIHYGEAPERGIYGEASADETAELLDEGIDVMPLPGKPKKEAN